MKDNNDDKCNGAFWMVVIAVVILSNSTFSLPASENWPQWRGPASDGSANNSAPPVEWSENKNIKWKKEIPGVGHSSPIIWENKIFIMTAKSEPIEERSSIPGLRSQKGTDPARQIGTDRQGENRNPTRGDNRRSGGRGFRDRGGFGPTVPTTNYNFITMCLSKDSGEVLWQKTSTSQKPTGGKHRTNSYSSGSPVTDGEVVVANFSSYGVFCYDLDGNLKWSKDLGDMRTRNGFGEGSSAALYKNLVYILWDTEDESFLYALDKESGDIKWKKTRDEATGWTTPVVITHKETPQVIINGTNKVRSYHALSGDIIWECGGQTTNAIPSIVADDATVYAMSGYRGNTAMAIELGGKGDITGSQKIAWKLNRGTPYVPSPLLYKGLLYFCKGNNGFFSCVETFSGKVFYAEERLPEISGVYSSPVAANNHIYLSGQNGNTAVIKAGKELEVVHVNTLKDSFNASPAISGNSLFLRGAKYLYRISND